jgi:hypothetical protein
MLGKFVIFHGKSFEKSLSAEKLYEKLATGQNCHTLFYGVHKLAAHFQRISAAKVFNRRKLYFTEARMKQK